MTKNFVQLSAETLTKIEGFGIKSKTVFKGFRRSCRLLKAYLEENGLDFNYEIGQKWLSAVRPCNPMTYSQYVIHAGQRRAVILLSEQQKGALDSWQVYPKKKTARPKTESYLQLLHSYQSRLLTVDMAKATISLALHVVSDFLIYLEKDDKLVINSITPHDVIGYFIQDSFSKRKPNGVKAYAYKVKAFLTFLGDVGTITESKLSLAVPKVFAKQESIVTVLSEKAVEALRSIEVESTVGTDIRNHAMMLLALRLGIRRSDIIKMKLTEIDWKNDEISFIQQKTKVPITLPLLPDVGNALMDYILNCRPQVSNDIVFVRYYSPHQALSPGQHILEKFLSEFDNEDCPERGLQILRRTCATLMLKNNIPRSVISASIGQTDPNSVDVYLSADEEKMRKCGLSLKGIECERGDLR